MVTKYNRRRTRKTKRRKYRGGSLTESEKDMLRQEYQGKKSPTIIELNKFIKEKDIISTGRMHEIITFVISLTGSALSSAPPSTPPSPPPSLESQEASYFIPKESDKNFESVMQDMMRPRS